MVVLGTGLAEAVHEIGSPRASVGFADLPGFPPEISAGQQPEVWSVSLGNVNVLVYRGRLHLYEGHSAEHVAHPVRTAVLAGCKTVLITNASGGIREDLGPGRLVLISDHLNLTGVSPLSGLPHPAHPADRSQVSGLPEESSPLAASAFVDLADAWSQRLRSLAADIDGTLAQGVYAQLPGPQFETPAEIRMLRAMGADLVGMSSALEAIAAVHLGAEVLGLSVVTNSAVGLTDERLAPGSVGAAARARAKDVGRVLREMLLRL